MIPDSFIIERKIYTTGEVIFEQDSPSPYFVSLHKGRVDLFFETVSLESSDESRKICTINAPCALLDSTVLLNYNYHNFTAVAQSAEVEVIIWNVSVEADDFKLNIDDAINFLHYISKSVNEQFALMDKVMSLRTVLDKTLHLYNNDIRKLLFNIEQKIELWSGIRLHDSTDVLRKVKYIKSVMPIVSDFMLENVLSGESKKAVKIVELAAEEYELNAGDYFFIDYDSKSPAIYLILAGEIELYYSGVALCRFRVDEILGASAYFYLEKISFDYKNVRFKVVSDCKLRKCFQTKNKLLDNLGNDKRVLQVLTIGILNKYANLLVYNAFIIVKLQDDIKLLDNNTNSFLWILFKVNQIFAEIDSFSDYKKQVVKYYNNIRNVSKNLRVNLKQLTDIEF